MNLNVMKYKNYVWPHNPSTINISVQRDLKEINLPFKGSIIQDFGREKRVVTGHGQFFGENCIEQFESLFSWFKQGSIGYLALPGMNSFLAAFKELRLVGNVLPNIVNYSFEFWEDLSLGTNIVDLQDEYYTALEGDTLWSIAIRYKTTL